MTSNPKNQKSTESSYELSEKETAEFKEVVNSGAEGASHALSTLIDEKIKIKAVNTRVLPVTKIGEVVGSPEDISATVILRVSGEVTGYILLIFRQENALSLADLLARRSLGTTKRLNKLDEIAIKETGNILSASLLIALTNKLGIHIGKSIPDLAIGMAKATVDNILTEFNSQTKKSLALEIDFELISESESVSAFFFLLFDLQSVVKVLKTLKRASRLRND